MSMTPEANAHTGVAGWREVSPDASAAGLNSVKPDGSPSGEGPGSRPEAHRNKVDRS